jgi:excisionase family DNA binding protein
LEIVMSTAATPDALLSDDENQDAAPAEPRWFSVKDAAGYLGVSQPTIFRWMKDGVLSFYKVGGSTRFTRDGLDAVVEKTTGRKEAEAAAGRCAACGHNGLLAGRIQGMGKLYFKPEKTRFWTLRESLVGTQAKSCPACGYIHLFADTTALNDLQPQPGEGEEEPMEPSDTVAEEAPGEED